MTYLLPKVAIVGRPNVGKSTLFNRFVGRRQAIVDDIPGVTRDRQYGQARWQGRVFQVIDTGGFIPGVEAGELSDAVKDQVFYALEEAEIVLFVVDGRFGLTPAEEEIARQLYREKLPVLLVVNKIDNPKEDALVGEFFRLGFTEIFGVAAESGRGIPELMKVIFRLLGDSAPELDSSRADLRLAILGQPNVGKSTLLNALIGEDRAVVHHEAGTTLDPLNIIIERGNKLIEFVDTAGIRRRRSTKGKVEKVGVLKAFEAVRLADLVLLVVDATQGVGAQDMKILSRAYEWGRAIIILLNKWDQMPTGSKIKDQKEMIYGRFKRHDDVPVMALSAKTGRGIKKLYQTIDEIEENYRRRIGTGELNRLFQKAIKRHTPPIVSGKAINLTYITQSGHEPPRFVIFTNRPKLVPESYLRYLERTLRKNFAFSGVPIRWALKEKR